MKYKAVILAAGIGSRLEPYSKYTPKCLIDLNGTNSIKHILYCLSQCGVNETVIVVGYRAEQIKEAIGNSIFNMDITYIYNKYYNHHGCEYSLALSAPALEDADKVLITEGDLLMPVEYYKTFTDDKSENAVAIRDIEINPKRSVVAIGKNDLVEKFIYDREHIDVFRFIEDKNMVLGESMQLWKFEGACKKLLVNLLHKFTDTISAEANIENGLYSINLALKTYKLKPVLITGDNWINLNTVEDVMKGRRELWLKR
ncbi:MULTISPECIES: phosphocholine cytidylyltransferase family protein [Clostridium]|uniref:DUF6564 domain-containing protein n=1 Tax=Clostridium sporogenes TaxID=1509 RepID=A0AAE6I6W8_CLOSG|nr:MULTISPECIES: DUF6564 domain-containing protein [Clostridium]MDU2832817.1 DUF6564 domain-containing protein [Clostridium botulinum]MDU4547865.1 DUF6564 domain-containing protein [Clostridium botulinum]MDU5011528.1 DUF6564 domain-containing protein [Clostridium botulinum]MDU5117313.1 DUF6564 domain-containing protein [Clostridium botulinum]QDY33396.1 hypothetical protein CGS26_13945 [Clostridium sporogenes]